MFFFEDYLFVFGGVSHWGSEISIENDFYYDKTVTAAYSKVLIS